MKPEDPLLLEADGTDFHEAVFAAFFDHLGKQSVDSEGVGGGVCRLGAAAADEVCYRREQAAAVAEPCEDLVEKGDGSGLAVGARDADEGELLRRVAVEGIGGEGEGAAGAPDAYGGNPFGNLSRRVVVDDRHGSGSDGLANVGVTVGGEAFHSDKKAARDDFAGVLRERENLHAFVAAAFDRVQTFYYIFKSHLSTILTIDPLEAAVPGAGSWETTCPLPS